MGTTGIAVRLWTVAAALRVLKHVLPLPRLVHLAQAPTATPDPYLPDALEAYLLSDAPFPRRAPGNCLERSLGAYHLLCRAGAAPRLVVGVRRTATSTIDGHVWLVVGGRRFGESVHVPVDFVPMVTFDETGRQLPPPERDVNSGGTPA